MKRQSKGLATIVTAVATRWALTTTLGITDEREYRALRRLRTSGAGARQLASRLRLLRLRYTALA